MSDENESEETTETEGMGNLRQSRDAAVERAAAAEAKVAQLERSDALRGAGLDMSNPVHSFFADKYDGEASADAVRNAFAESGLGDLSTPGSPQPASEPTQQPVDVAHSVGQAFGGDTRPPGQPDQLDPMDDAYAQFHSARQRGVPEENAFEGVIQGVINGVLQEQDGILQPGRFVYDRDHFHDRLAR